MSTAPTTTMPFWDHVYELRRRMLFVVAAVFVCSVGSYFFVPTLVEIVNGIIAEELYATSITEGFVTRLKVAVLIGAAASVPLQYESSMPLAA